MTMPVFSQLLEPEGIAPARDYADTGTLICNQVPSAQLRAKVRFIVKDPVRFEVCSDDDVRRLLKHWRAELSPEIESSDTDIFVSGFEDDEALKDLASDAPIIRLVNHLFARALDLNSSDIHFEPNETHSHENKQSAFSWKK